jgi:hypothetical protein
MRNLIKLLSVSLVVVNLFKVYAADEQNQENKVPRSFYEKLSPTILSGNANEKPMKSRLARLKEEQITILLETSTAEWDDFAHELAQVIHLEKRPNVFDRGFFQCFDTYDVLTNVANRCIDLNAPSEASYMLLLNSMDAEFRNKHKALSELEKRYNENPRDINICLQYSMAYLAMADAIPTEQIDVSTAYRKLFPFFCNQKNLMHGLRKEKIAGTIPQNHFDMTRRLYFQKSAMLHWAVRYLLGLEIDNDLDPPYALHDQRYLNFSSIEPFLNLIHTKSMDSIIPITNLGCSLLIHKITEVFFDSPEFKKERSIQKSQAQAKKKEKQLRNRSLETKQPQDLPPEAGQVMAIVRLLQSHADELSQQSRRVEAEYRECGAFFLYSHQLYSKFHRNKGGLGQSFIGGDRVSIKDIFNLMEKIDEVRRTLDRVALIKETILGSEQLNTVYSHFLWCLCTYLHKEEFVEISSAEKFKYYTLFRENFESITDNALMPKNKTTFDYTKAAVYQHAAQAAPDNATEQKYLQLAIELLPEIQEDKSIFDYYMDSCKLDTETPGLSGRKIKQMEIMQGLKKRSLIRAYTHLDLLCATGHIGKALNIVENHRKIYATKKNEARHGKELTREQIVRKIMAEKEARNELQERLARQKSELKERRVQKGDGCSAEKYELPYWYCFSNQAATSSQAEILAELAQREEKAALKAATKAAKNKTVSVKLDPDIISDSDGRKADEAAPIKEIPVAILVALNKHQEIFRTLFSRYEGGAAYNNSVSVDRNAFLKMIVDLGGEHITNQGNGAHEFIRLVLGGQLLDMEAVDPDLDFHLARAVDKANSHGTMTLSWPKKCRGHNRRFLLPEQVLNARLILSANGLTPSCLPEEEKLD